MHTVTCKCGYVIEVTPPSSQAGYIVWDGDVEESIDTRNEAIRDFHGGFEQSPWIESHVEDQTVDRPIGLHLRHGGIEILRRLGYEL